MGFKKRAKSNSEVAIESPAPIDDRSGFLRVLRSYYDGVAGYKEFLETLAPVVKWSGSADLEYLKEVPDAIDHIDGLLHTLRSALANGTEPLDLTEEGARLLARVNDNIKKRKKLENHSSLLYRAVLTGLVGQFEVLVAAVASSYYKRSDDQPLGKKELKLSEIRSFSSISDAVSSVREQAVDQLLRESVIKWDEFFSSNIRIEISAQAPHWGHFVEYLQRRHIIVHADGRITQRYLDLVPDDVKAALFEEPLACGQVATISTEYIEKAISDFQTTGLLFAFAAWSKLHPKEYEILEAALLHLVFKLLNDQAWQAAKDLSTWGKAKESLTGAVRVILQINEWLASKRLGEWDSIEADVREFDTSALDPRYVLARLALLEEAESFKERYLEYGREPFTADELRDFPLFDDIRATQSFQELEASASDCELEESLVALSAEPKPTEAEQPGSAKTIVPPLN